MPSPKVQSQKYTIKWAILEVRQPSAPGCLCAVSALVSAGEQARIASAAADARAASTRRTCAGQWTRFEAWCRARGADDLPAAPVLVAAYLTERAETARTSTVRVAAAAMYGAALLLPYGFRSCSVSFWKEVTHLPRTCPSPAATERESRRADSRSALTPPECSPRTELSIPRRFERYWKAVCIFGKARRRLFRIHQPSCLIRPPARSSASGAFPDWKRH